MGSHEKGTLSRQLFFYLLNYAKESLRKFPWREKNLSDYELLITEILLKRTTASKVVKIWSKFFQQFPDFSFLAQTNEADISQVLEPLGLHRQRASHLKALAAKIIEKFDGQVPKNYEDIIGLPGVGQYASGVFLLRLGLSPDKLPYDINIERVFTRLAGKIIFKQEPKSLYSEILSIEAEKRIEILYALLDIGSKICRPLKPRCEICCLKNLCQFPSNCYDISYSFVYRPRTRPVLVMSKQEWALVRKEGYILKQNQINLPIRFFAFVYVQKPLKTFTGRVNCEKTNSGLKITLIEEYKPKIPLTMVGNICCSILLRAPITWISPRTLFDTAIKKLQNFHRDTNSGSSA